MSKVASVLSPRPFTRRAGIGALAGLVLTLGAGLSACGSSSTSSTKTASSSASSGGASSAAAALLPASFRGGITVASDESYAPIDFKDAGGGITGFDFDLGQALGTDLGTKLTFTNVTFDGIIPALQAKKYDLVMSAMTDNIERQKTLTFVDYYSAGTSFVVAAGNPKAIKTLGDLCGKHVALEKGTTQETVANDQVTKCAATGKALTVDSLPTDSAALLEIQSGKADADINDSPVAAYNAAQSSGKFDSIEIGSLGTAPYGIGMLKADADLAKAVQQAFKDVVANGTYAKILAKYGIADGSLTTGAINGGTS